MCGCGCAVCAVEGGSLQVVVELELGHLGWEVRSSQATAPSRPRLRRPAWANKVHAAMGVGTLHSSYHRRASTTYTDSFAIVDRPAGTAPHRTSSVLFCAARVR